MTTKRPTKTPAKPTKRERPGRKTPASPGRRYTEEERAAAIASLERVGMADTARELGIPKQTLSRWARAAEVDLGEAARARTANAVEHTRARAAEVTTTTVQLLEQHIAQAGDYLATVAGVNALAAQLIARADPATIKIETGIAGRYAVVEDPAAQEVAKVALALDGLPLATRDAEGILTRAIHDLQLLRGEATERGELVVEFNVPRPTPSATAVVEHPAIEQ